MARVETRSCKHVSYLIFCFKVTGRSFVLSYLRNKSHFSLWDGINVYGVSHNVRHMWKENHVNACPIWSCCKVVASLVFQKSPTDFLTSSANFGAGCLLPDLLVAQIWPIRFLLPIEPTWLLSLHLKTIVEILGARVQRDRQHSCGISEKLRNSFIRRLHTSQGPSVPASSTKIIVRQEWLQRWDKFE